MPTLTDEDEHQIIYLRDFMHRHRLVCGNIDLLLKCYAELEAERKKSEQLMKLCEICKEGR